MSRVRVGKVWMLRVERGERGQIVWLIVWSAARYAVRREVSFVRDEERVEYWVAVRGAAFSDFAACTDFAACSDC